MPNLVPLHSVILSRPHSNKRKDKEGNPVHQRIVPPVGKPFDFTDDEVDDLKASGHEFRQPTNEGGQPTGDADDADRAAEEAARAADGNRSASLDAANTARAGAKGKAKPAVEVTGANQSEGSAVVEEEEEL